MSDDIEHRVRFVEMGVQGAMDKLSAHEQVCAERYSNINGSISAINGTVRWAAIALLSGMAGILIKLLFFST